MPKVTKPQPKEKVRVKTIEGSGNAIAYDWWNAEKDTDLCNQLLSTATYLKTSQNYRYRQAAIYARLYGNQSLFSFIGSNLTKLDTQSQLPLDKPTFNVIQSSVDTLVSRITQSRPAPVFLTDNSDYKERNLAKKLNNFILGEFYQAKAYEKSEYMLRDALVEGTGVLKIIETSDHKAGLERIFLTELLVDQNEAVHGDPRQMYQMKLMDRAVLIANSPKYKQIIELAARAYPDNSSDSSKTVSDMVMVVEGWRLPSRKGAGDGRHVIATSAGPIFDEEWTKDKFPFVFMHYSPRFLGFWSQGLAEQLMGTQLEINTLLYTISRAIKLVGVPRVFQEESSKVISAHNNNEIGVIIKYRGIKPTYEVAPCNAPELYAERDKLIQYAYQQCGVSAMQATGQMPAGLESGEAQRTYDNISTDRYASLARRYDNVFIELAYAMIDKAMDIAERDGKYSTVYPNKNGTKEIDLPKATKLRDAFVIQCFNTSSLPRDPAGRMAKVTEMAQAGMITLREARRLMDFSDLQQVETLANASEERIYQYLDEIVEDGKYTPPDPFMDLQLAKETTVQYYNLYVSAKLEENKAQMLRDFYTQILDLMQAAQPPVQPMAPNQPQAVPQPAPQSPLLQNAPSQGAPQ